MALKTLCMYVLQQRCSGLSTGALAVLGPCKGFPAVILMLAILLTLPVSALAVPPGTIITNTAQADFGVGGSSTITSFSNSVTTVTVVERTVSSIELLQYAPSHPSPEMVPVAISLFSSDGSATGLFAPLAPPIPAGSSTPIDLSSPVPLVPSDLFQKQEPVFVRLIDLDQNLDPGAMETIDVVLTSGSSGEAERLRFVESGPDTGIFVGYIQARGDIAVSPYDGFLTAIDESEIVATYTDVADGSDASAVSALVDPFGIIFDSLTGQPVDGAVITLVDTTTGSPAAVYGDNGVDTYPATVVSGGTATDSGGQVYNFPPGGYRFPLVAPGSYRLDVVPPAGYAAPSTVPTSQLQALPGAPFAIVDPGSRGEPFVINAGPAIHIDFPVDLSASGLWISKTASHDTASVGDFIQYRLTLQNLSDASMGSVTISDRLPLGFRFQNPSALRDGTAKVSTTISNDGRTLNFDMGSLGGNTSVDLSYVVEIAAGARIGQAINQASASAAGGINSNTATATVNVTEDLFRSKAIIMGRVTSGACDADTNPEENGIGGVRIYLEDGTYAITDEKGRYHFEGVSPGTHVVQLDLETLPDGYEMVLCNPNNRFADRPYAQFVDLQGGTLWRADFQAVPQPLPPPEPPAPSEPPAQGQIDLRMQSELQADLVQYRIDISGRTVPATNLRLNIMLPESFEYVPGSSQMDDHALPDPKANGNVLVYRLPDLAGDQRRILHIAAMRNPETAIGDHTTKAVLLFDTAGDRSQRTPMVTNRLTVKTREQIERQPEIILQPKFDIFSARLSEQDKALLAPVIAKLEKLKIIHIYITGHSDPIPIPANLRHVYADNYELSEARAQSVERYLAAALDLREEQTTLVGRGPDEPRADNDTAEGRALNRRVELRVKAEKVSSEIETHLTKQHDQATKATRGGQPAIVVSKVEQADADLATEKMDEPAAFDEAWLETAQPGRAWLWPAEDSGPSIPSAKIVIQHDPQYKAVLMLDGQEVGPLNFDGMLKNLASTTAVSRWRGVDLKEGDNRFEVIFFDPAGKEIDRLSRIVHYAGPPIRAILIPEQSYLVADGKNIPVLAVRLVDKDGFPTREGLVGGFSVEPPFMPYRNETDVQALSLTGLDLHKPHYKVGRDGIALIKLQPTTQSGEVVVHLPFNERTQEMRLWLQPEQREWILVGLAEGTVGYDTISGNMESLDDAQGEDGFYDDGRLAFFAKGRIKGKWLLTAAYDSAKEKDEQRLFQTIDPDTYYTLYGDATRQAYDAASREKLYLKIERDHFYALFGDFDTGLTVTQLARYSRSLTGVKSELRTRNFGFNLFGSETDQAFVKDEIQGNGTSGLYRLSRSQLVMNSEKVTIETRDRYRSEIILSSRTLVRHIDYNIDYDAGTLFFKEPVYSRDQDLNPIFIVADYEAQDPADESYSYGGRGAVRLLDQSLEVGATYVHEGQSGGEGDLGGVDVTFEVTENTEIKAEAATSKSDEDGSEISGDAYLAEIRHHSSNLDGTVYIKEQESGYGLGQQSGSEDGTRKIGLDAAYRFGSTFKLDGQAYRQYNLSTSAERNVGQLNGVYTEDNYNLRAGLRDATDRMGDGSVYRSTQVLGGVGYQMLDNRLQLRLDHDQSLSGSNDNLDYPTRTLLGADYKLTRQTALCAEQEFSYSDSRETEGTRAGLKTNPWTGGQIGSSMERQYDENGERVLANLGLVQTWKINDHWSMSGGLDRSQTLSQDDVPRFDTDVAPAVGSTEDFTAVSLGTSYKQEYWSAALRLETRYADTEDKWGITGGMYVEPEQGLGLSAGAQVFRTDSTASGDAIWGDLRLGVAYRPLRSRWIFLDRLDYIFEEETDDTFTFDTWRLVNNLNANYKLNFKTQIAFQYGLKYVQTGFEGSTYSGVTDLFGIEGRYDLTKRWDIGAHGNVLHSWNASQFDYSTGLSVGYQVVTNAWVSVGYNFDGFRDEDFTGGSYTAQGPYFRFRFKFDQESAHKALKWFE